MRSRLRSSCTRRRSSRPHTTPCARNTASAFPTTASTPTRHRRAPASSSREALPKRTDFSPFVAVAGQDKPALSVDDQQICVEGLKHGESYAITLREGLPSTVGEDLLKTADFSIYVRDRSPFVRLSGKAYVLPKTGQQGIPLVSVNTDAIKVTIYRIGDRNLIDTVLGGDFERNLYGYTLNDIAEQKGEKVWTGELDGGEGAQHRHHHQLPGERGGARACSPASTCLPPCRRASPSRKSTASARPNGSSSPTSGSPPIRGPTASMPSSIRSRRPRRSAASSFA